MELLLLILKIILLVLGVVLGIILLLLELILFVPIRYEISGEIQAGWKIKIKGKIRYLLSIFKLIFSYLNGQTDMQIYLFGCLIKPKSSENDPSVEDEGSNNEQIQEDHFETAHSIEATEISTCEVNHTVQVDEDRDKDKDREKDLTEKSLDPELENESEQSEMKTETVKNQKKVRLKNNSRKKTKKEKGKFDFQFLKQEFTDEHNRSVVKKCFKELKYLLRHFRFRKIKTDLMFSTGDPARTGQMLGILCMVPMLYRYEIKLVPDFESEDFYLNGTFCISGKVRLIHVLLVVLRLILDREVRLVMAKVMNQFK